MTSILKRFYRNDDGAITVDWVVITAGIVILAVTLGIYLRDGTIEAGDRVGAHIAAQADP